MKVLLALLFQPVVDVYAGFYILTNDTSKVRDCLFSAEKVLWCSFSPKLAC